jgi:hypothetical protein
MIGDMISEDRELAPPKCIFVPNTAMSREMIKALALHTNKETQADFLLRFGLLKSFL